MSESAACAAPQLSKHRIEALVNGIYAAAMTLLFLARPLSKLFALRFR